MRPPRTFRLVLSISYRLRFERRVCKSLGACGQRCLLRAEICRARLEVRVREILWQRRGQTLRAANDIGRADLHTALYAGLWRTEVAEGRLLGAILRNTGRHGVGR